MKNKAVVILLFLTLAVCGSAAADQWIHVKVENPGEELVTINLPLSLLHAAVAMIPEEAQHQGQLELEELDMDWQELMTLWSEIRDAPDATYVTVDSPEQKVVVRKEGEFMVVKTDERSADGAEVNAQLPLAVIDALLSGPEGTFNFEAALQALADFGPGNLVTVRDGEQSVRVWIDDVNAAE